MYDIETRGKQEGEKARELQRQFKEALTASSTGDDSEALTVDAPEPEAVVADAPEGRTDNAPSPEKEPAPAPEPLQKKTGDDEDWEQKYRSLQGVYRTEKRVSESRIAELQGQIDTLLAQLRAAQAAPPPEAPKTESKPKVEKIDPEAFNDYGEEFKALVGKVNTLADENAALRSQLDTQARAVDEKVEPLRRSTEQVVTDRFLTELGRLCPTYREMDNDPDFLAWLQKPDAMDPQDRTRKQLLDEVVVARRADKTAAFFNEYLRLHGATPENDKPEPPAPPEKALVPPNIQPAARPRSGAAPAGKKIFTRGEVAQFYADIARGEKYLGKEAEVLAKKQEIALAAKEGRIR